MCVLLIGSYPPLLRALQRGLAEEGYTVAVARAGQEACARLSTAAYDAIVLDSTGPEEAALGRLQRWRRAGLKTPVLVLTAPNSDNSVGGHSVEAADWLTKPFELDELLARLRALLGRGA